MLADVVILNGASSSGKSSIAKALQEALQHTYLNFSIDSILYALPPSDLERMMRGDRITRAGYEYARLVDGYYAAAEALLATGNRLILDNAIKPSWRSDVARRLRPYHALWVGVLCEIEDLRERERARGDRAIGTAEREAAWVHEGFQYDLIVNTSASSAADAAHCIRALMEEG